MNRIITIIILLLPCRVFAEASEAASDSTRQLRSVEVAVQRYTSPLRLRADGTRTWQLSALQGMPKIMGNTDPLHVAELLPGVQTSSEFDAGLHILGCDNAHNEVSLDGTPLYGVQHLLGFFSVFNAAHFQTMTYAPAASLESSSNRLGGLLRMNTMDAVPERTTGEIAVGPMSSQATLRLPIGRRTLLVASAREAYMNLLYSRWMKYDDEQLRYSFGDYNLTLLHQATSRDRLCFNFYGGHDSLGCSAPEFAGSYERAVFYTRVHQYHRAHYDNCYDEDRQGYCGFSQIASSFIYTHLQIHGFYHLPLW